MLANLFTPLLGSSTHYISSYSCILALSIIQSSRKQFSANFVY